MHIHMHKSAHTLALLTLHMFSAVFVHLCTYVTWSVYAKFLVIHFSIILTTPVNVLLEMLRSVVFSTS